VDDVLQLILVIFHHRHTKKNTRQFFLNSKCEKKTNQQKQTKQPLILLHTTKEDKFVSYYLKIDDLFLFEKKINVHF